MSTIGRRRKCCSCHQLYDPEPRSHYHQAYCSQPQCRKASKAASQRRWRESDKGRDYFRGEANRIRVKQWRKAHPGYSRKRSRKRCKPSGALQEQSTPQTPVGPGIKPSLALQEMMLTQSLLLTGLIVTLTGAADGALQEDIAPTIDRLIRLGQQVQGPALSFSEFSKGSGGMPHGGLQTSAVQAAVTAGPPAVQLDRPSPGP